MQKPQAGAVNQQRHDDQIRGQHIADVRLVRGHIDGGGQTGAYHGDAEEDEEMSIAPNKRTFAVVEFFDRAVIEIRPPHGEHQLNRPEYFGDSLS